MKVLFIGGTGVLSSACTELAIARDINLYHLNRGLSADIRNISGVKTIVSDIRDIHTTKKALKDYNFDVVVDFIAYKPEHIYNDLELFKHKTKQFIFISSASAYRTPQQLPITEDMMLENPFWEYSQNKIACEKALKDSVTSASFSYTIIRPSHTYDKTKIPTIGGYTVLHRMLKGLPVILSGDGTSLWTLTHHKDFAVGLVGLLGNPKAYNNMFHITSDEWLSWKSIYQILAKELEVEPNIVNIPSEMIALYNKTIGDGVIGDKSQSLIFDNSKIKWAVPEFHPQIKFKQGAKEIIKYYKENTQHLDVDSEINLFLEKITTDYRLFISEVKNKMK